MSSAVTGKNHHECKDMTKLKNVTIILEGVVSSSVHAPDTGPNHRYYRHVTGYVSIISMAKCTDWSVTFTTYTCTVYTHTCTCTCIYVHTTYTQMQIHLRVCVNTHTHAHTHTCAHTEVSQ